MTQERWTSVLTWTSVALVLVMVAVVGRRGAGREASAAEQASTSSGAAAARPAETPGLAPAAEKAEAKKKEFRGRLPAYYGRVVDDAQRKKIYAIQGEFAPGIDALKAQLAALTEERNKQVEAVLSPEQLKTVEDFKAEAKAKRDKAKR